MGERIDVDRDELYEIVSRVQSIRRILPASGSFFADPDAISRVREGLRELERKLRELLGSSESDMDD